MHRSLVIGFIVGALFGVAVSFSYGGVGFPGMFAAVLAGRLLSGGPFPGWWLISASVNAVFYGGIGMFAGWFAARQRSRDQTGLPSMPECGVCGYKWPRPNHPACPKCRANNAFKQWLGRTLPEYRCDNCGYVLTDNMSGVCPECGKPT